MSWEWHAHQVLVAEAETPLRRSVPGSCHSFLKMFVHSCLNVCVLTEQMHSLYMRPTDVRPILLTRLFRTATNHWQPASNHARHETAGCHRILTCLYITPWRRKLSWLKPATQKNPSSKCDCTFFKLGRVFKLCLESSKDWRLLDSNLKDWKFKMAAEGDCLGTLVCASELYSDFHPLKLEAVLLYVEASATKL